MVITTTRFPDRSIQTAGTNEAASPAEMENGRPFRRHGSACSRRVGRRSGGCDALQEIRVKGRALNPQSCRLLVVDLLFLAMVWPVVEGIPSIEVERLGTAAASLLT